jgi:hypothetical protein
MRRSPFFLSCRSTSNRALKCRMWIHARARWHFLICVSIDIVQFSVVLNIVRFKCLIFITAEITHDRKYRRSISIGNCMRDDFSSHRETRKEMFERGELLLSYIFVSSQDITCGFRMLSLLSLWNCKLLLCISSLHTVSHVFRFPARANSLTERKRFSRDPACVASNATKSSSTRNNFAYLLRLIILSCTIAKDRGKRIRVYMYVHTHISVRMYIYLYSILLLYDCFIVTIVKCHWLLVTDDLWSANYIAEPCVHIKS